MKHIYRFLFIFGFICYGFGVYYIWESNKPNKLAFENYHARNKQITKQAVVVPLPARIIITELSIDLPVFPAKIINGQWDMTTNGASYLIFSPIPGETGNSIIYAHNWTRLFGPLLEARKGQEVIIEYADKSRKTFAIEYLTIVPKTQSSILDQTSDTRITLYTCTGFLDAQRMVAVALLKK